MNEARQSWWGNKQQPMLASKSHPLQVPPCQQGHLSPQLCSARDHSTDPRWPCHPPKAPTIAPALPQAADRPWQVARYLVGYTSAGMMNVVVFLSVEMRGDGGYLSIKLVGSFPGHGMNAGGAAGLRVGAAC